MTHAQQPSLPTLLVPPEAQLGALTATFPVLPTPHEHPRSQPCPGLAARAVIDGVAGDVARSCSGCGLAVAARAAASSWPR